MAAISGEDIKKVNISGIDDNQKIFFLSWKPIKKQEKRIISRHDFGDHLKRFLSKSEPFLWTELWYHFHTIA